MILLFINFDPQKSFFIQSSQISEIMDPKTLSVDEKAVFDETASFVQDRLECGFDFGLANR